MNDLPNIEVADGNTANKDGTSLSIGKELHNFIEQISSLSMTLTMTMEAVISAFEESKKRTTELIESEKRYLDPNSKINVEHVDFVQKLQIENKHLGLYLVALKTVPRSYLMTLVSHYDAFLGRLIKLILLAKPELLTISEKIFRLLNWSSLDR